MAGDEELYQKVRAWMDRLPRTLRCPACDDHHWELRSLDEMLGRTSGASGGVPAAVAIMCQCCGHLSFFDTKIMGL